MAHVKNVPPVRRIALIARDWITQTRSRGYCFASNNMGFAPFFGEIARTCSRLGADLLLFSLWAHNEDEYGALSKSQLFPIGTRHQIALIEVMRGGKECMEVWYRNRHRPVRFDQCFSRSSDATHKKQNFIARLDRRQLGSCLIVVCGESNIIATHRNGRITDSYRFRKELQRRGIQVILNPIHDYMRRYEMVRKRAALSRWTQAMVSIWNRGCRKGSESKLPWQLHLKGRRADQYIKEIVNPVHRQPGVRVGMLDLREVRGAGSSRKRRTKAGRR